MTHRRVILAALVAALALGVATTAAQAASGALRLGFFDYHPFTTGDAAPWIARAQAEGTHVVRLSLAWSSVAPSARPATFDAANPADPAYRWPALDQQVKALHAAGFDPLLTVLHAPTWAEGPNRPASAFAGSWNPDPAQLAAFLHAAATRYSGTFPDPAGPPGATLPRVRQWQVWNEPNLSRYLAPQWERRGHRLIAASPSRFRTLLNAGYAAIKKVQPDATVLAGGTAPYGDPTPGGDRIAPALFLRDLLCLHGRTKLARIHHCPVTRFDAYDHHPYAVAGPTRKALNADDVATPDLGKLTRIVTRAARLRTLAPRGPKPLWITEVSYDSSPPDPDGVPLPRHAAWLEESLHVLWAEGARTILWFSIVDQPPQPSYDTTYQAGLYFLDGRPKPAATAFSFPFVRDGRRIWGRAPADGPVVIERRDGRRWRTITRLAGRRGAVFQATVSAPAHARLRARQGTAASLTWPVD